MMDFELENAVAILGRTPELLKTWLQDLPEPWVYNNDGEGTWSAFDVVGHLIQGDRADWIPRMQLVMSSGGIKEFEPFDRFAQFEASKGKSIADLLSTFEELRQANLSVLSESVLQESDYERTGKHPKLGILNLRQLLSTWVAHDLNHLGQIAEVMARQYKEEVGPWKVYLGILGD